MARKVRLKVGDPGGRDHPYPTVRPLHFNGSLRATCSCENAARRKLHRPDLISIEVGRPAVDLLWLCRPCAVRLALAILELESL